MKLALLSAAFAGLAAGQDCSALENRTNLRTLHAGFIADDLHVPWCMHLDSSHNATRDRVAPNTCTDFYVAGGPDADPREVKYCYLDDMNRCRKTASILCDNLPPYPAPPPSSPPAPPASPPSPPVTLDEIPRLGASMSSTWGGLNATLAIDGDPATICATNDDANTWLSVRIPVNTVGYVIVQNRQDGKYEERLSHFEIWVGQEPGDITGPSATRCGASPIVPPAPVGAGSFRVTCPPGTVGAYVTLTLPGSGGRYITIAELNVYGTPAPSPPSPPSSPAVADIGLATLGLAAPAAQALTNADGSANSGAIGGVVGGVVGGLLLVLLLMVLHKHGKLCPAKGRVSLVSKHGPASGGPPVVAAALGSRAVLAEPAGGRLGSSTAPTAEPPTFLAGMLASVRASFSGESADVPASSSSVGTAV